MGGYGLPQPVTSVTGFAMTWFFTGGAVVDGRRAVASPPYGGELVAWGGRGRTPPLRMAWRLVGRTVGDAVPYGWGTRGAVGGGTHGSRPTLYYFVGQGPRALPGGAVQRADRGVRPYGGLLEVRWGGTMWASSPTEWYKKCVRYWAGVREKTPRTGLVRGEWIYFLRRPPRLLAM